MQVDGSASRRPLVAAMLNNSVASCRLLLQAGASLRLHRADAAAGGPGQVVDTELVLVAARRCCDVIQRLLLAAAAALGLQLQV